MLELAGRVETCELDQSLFVLEERLRLGLLLLPESAIGIFDPQQPRLLFVSLGSHFFDEFKLLEQTVLYWS
jgi:hypothetical protein